MSNPKSQIQNPKSKIRGLVSADARFPIEAAGCPDAHRLVNPICL